MQTVSVPGLYHYRNPGAHNPSSYEIGSDGADGLEGTSDDIVSWK
jgi:general secretion pathway protein G